MNHKLAPMTTELRIMTWCLMLLPAIFVAAAFAAPPIVGFILLSTAAFITLLYASVWLAFRPSRFELDREALRIVWPVRARVIERANIKGARLVTAKDFRTEYGLGMRIGAGGLWGGFGLLKTGRETFSLWISRTDRFVIVELRNDRPLLLTPEDPERFVAAIAKRTS